MMKRENALVEKSLAFAVRMVKLYTYLCEKKKEYVMSKQILRSGTVIGVLVRVEQNGESSKDFIHKLIIHNL